MYLTTTSKEITEREIKHAELARNAGSECIVLLENDGTLPLKKGSSIALYGAGARYTVKGGTGSGDVNSRSSVNIEEGLLRGDFSITTDTYLYEYDKIYDKAVDDYEQFVADTVANGILHEWTVRAENPFKHPTSPAISAEMAKSQKADACIYVIPRNSGEGADRKAEEGDYELTKEELADLKVLGAVYGNVIVVLNIGAVINMTSIKAIEGIGSVLLMGQLGCSGGDSLCAVIDGTVNPSGKLVDTWAKDYFDYPSSKDFSHNNGDVDDEYYTDGIYVGYRYFDSFDVKPAYCFGYGLSYTNFDIKTTKAEADKTKITVTVKVKNTGSCSGKEVVQLYIQKPESFIGKAKRELCGFAKTSLLEPNEECEVKITFDMNLIYSYDEAACAYIIEKGDYTLFVGNSIDASTPEVGINLDDKVIIRQCTSLFASDVTLKEIECDREYKKEDTKLSVSINAKNFETQKVKYSETNSFLCSEVKDVITAQDVIDKKYTVEELVSQLTVEQMAEFCVGVTRHKGGGVVGLFAKRVPGAAGETASICEETRGIRPLILADGPAGVRIDKTFDYEGQTYYQFCTAIPVGWSLAMSWDVQMLENLGKMIGREMKEYRVDLWLAPALNIHRNPLCGRNFEYYSEDPLVSGMMAAALTNGVQTYAGIGTTIKHFAANNLEENRYFNNSHLSERALREIYLKGFEICVKDSQPKSLMTSYNLINGVHTANSRSLVTHVLRDEWGYEGLVMTDWSTTENKPSLQASHVPVYPIASAVGCIAARNDLIMPGCNENVDDIIRAVKENVEIDGFRITVADLQTTTINVMKFIIEAMSAAKEK